MQLYGDDFMLPEENILFQGTDNGDCLRMLECFDSSVKKFPAGSIIADFSEISDKIGVILSGSANMVRYDVNGVRTIIEVLGEQGIFGEFFMFTGSYRNSIRVEASAECEVLFFRNSELTKRCENACSCHSRVVENLLALMSEKAISLSERIEVLSQRSIADKLMSFLQITADRTPADRVPELPFSVTALSDYLCVNRSALQREIARMKREGMIETEGRKFRICRHEE